MQSFGWAMHIVFLPACGGQHSQLINLTVDATHSSRSTGLVPCSLATSWA